MGLELYCDLVAVFVACRRLKVLVLNSATGSRRVSFVGEATIALHSANIAGVPVVNKPTVVRRRSPQTQSHGVGSAALSGSCSVALKQCLTVHSV